MFGNQESWYLDGHVLRDVATRFTFGARMDLISPQPTLGRYAGNSAQSGHKFDR